MMVSFTFCVSFFFFFAQFPFCGYFPFPPLQRRWRINFFAFFFPHIAFDEAFAHWRVLTSYLQPASASSSPLVKQSRTQATRAIADRIGGAFAPWESMPGAPEQRADLVAICEEAASAAALVFAQPSTFAYVWEPVNLGLDEEPRKVTVVKPGLVKVVKKGEEDPTRLLDAAGAGEDGVPGRATIVQPRHVSLTFPVGYVAE